MTKEELAGIIKRYVAKQVSEIKPEPVDTDAIVATFEQRFSSLQLSFERQARETLDKAVDKIPAPKDGKDGKDALPVDIEAIAASFERRFSDLQLSWERQARDTFEKALDRMPIPKDGEDGKDALPIEDIEIKQDGRHVIIKLGDVEHTIKLDTVIDQGVWTDKEYEKGDAVTYGGSLWIAQEDQPEGAPGATKAWRLAVKKGRDGRDLRDSASQHDKNKGISL